MTTDRPDLAIVRPSPLLLSQFGAMRREPTRPAQFRFSGFNAAFDFDTLSYDAFRLPDGRVALSGPPLFNLTPLVEAMRVTAPPHDLPCRVEITGMDRHARIIVDAPSDATTLRVDMGSGEAEVPIGTGEGRVFAGRRVLLTQSKDNHLHWIADWIAYHRDVHGADAVLLYDNGSTRYTECDVLDTIARIGGIAAARVVSWPFRFGPQGDGSGKFWDSDFCQHGVLEHARWRFLQGARGVLSGDVDELMVSRSGRSVFDAVEQSIFGVASYRGRWVVGTRGMPLPTGDHARSHRDYGMVLRPRPKRLLGLTVADREACPPKWTVVPARCPTGSQWGIHTIFGFPAARLMSRDLSYRHFREISNSWKYDRDDRKQFDPNIHEKDDLLAAHYARTGW